MIPLGRIHVNKLLAGAGSRNLPRFCGATAVLADPDLLARLRAGRSFDLDPFPKCMAESRCFLACFQQGSAFFAVDVPGVPLFQAGGFLHANHAEVGMVAMMQDRQRGSLRF